MTGPYSVVYVEMSPMFHPTVTISSPSLAVTLKGPLDKRAVNLLTVICNKANEAEMFPNHTDQLQHQLGVCRRVAETSTSWDEFKIEDGDYGWSPAYQAVLTLRKKYDALLQHHKDLKHHNRGPNL